MSREEWFDAYWRNELNPAQQEELEQRIANNPEWKSAWEEYRLMAEAVMAEGWKAQLKAIGEDQKKERLLQSRTVYPSPIQIAFLAAGVALFIGLWWAYSNPDAGNAPIAEEKTDTTAPASPPAETPEAPAVENVKSSAKTVAKAAGPTFLVFEELEGLIAPTLRGYADIEVLHPAPEDSLTAGDSCRFQWKSTLSETLTLSLMDNRGRPVANYVAEDQAYTLQLPSTPGLYYWQLETGEELVYIHKFTIH